MSGIINSAGSKSGVIGTTELDYETGTWTPTVTGSSGSLNLNYEDGSYVKIGKMVHVNGKFLVTSDNSHSGQLHIDSLPFANRAQYDGVTLMGSMDGLMAMTGYTGQGGQMASNDNKVGLRKIPVTAGGNIASMTKADINHDGNTTYGPGTRWNPYFSFTYQTA